jgi:hypothetical protein
VCLVPLANAASDAVATDPVPFARSVSSRAQMTTDFKKLDEQRKLKADGIEELVSVFCFCLATRFRPSCRAGEVAVSLASAPCLLASRRGARLLAAALYRGDVPPTGSDPPPSSRCSQEVKIEQVSADIAESKNEAGALQTALFACVALPRLGYIYI